MKIFKRSITLLLCAMLLVAFSAISVSAVTTIEYGDFTLAINGDNTYSAYKYNGTSLYAAVPDDAYGIPIVEISGNCFKGSTAKYILLSKNITTIRDYAFYGAENLVSIAIPDSVTSIGSSAFGYCTSLVTVDFADNITIDTLPSSLFQGCSSMKKVEIPASVTTIKNNFLYGTAVESVVIPDTVTSLGSYAFSDCTALTSVSLSSKLTELGAYTFSGCTALESVVIPEGVTSIGNRCFYECTALSDAEIPMTCTSIGVKGFYNCTSLTSVFIPRNVATIGADCFYPMSIKQKIVANGFTDTYIQEYCTANGVNFTDLDANIGDANYDNDVDIKDVTEIQKYLAKISGIDSSEKRSFADSNKDGKISIRDATLIQLYVAKYIFEF